MKKQTPNAQRRTPNVGLSSAFTLIELLVVIAIIIILMGLLFPAFRGVQDQAKRTQAKNDLTQIVTALNAFYTEYGKYPLPSGITVDTTYGGPSGTSNGTIISELRASTVVQNTRQIAFISPPNVKDGSHPRGGIATQSTTLMNGLVSVSATIGDFVDAWGTPYLIAIDGDYSGQVQVGAALNYSDLIYSPDPPPSGPAAVRTGVIAASYGADATKGTATPASSSLANSDDVISWQ